ncbi:hypothetical protein BBP00_00009822, partial [Phytophthora kernoviae]
MVTKALLGPDPLPTELNALKHTRDGNNSSECDLSKCTKKKSAKKRRTTYDIRKQQKSELVLDVTELHKQLGDLKQCILIHQGEASKSVQCTEAGNLVMKEYIHDQHNAEIIISEMFGSITIREDSDFSDTELSQMRLVVSTAHGAIVESNSVIFSEIIEAADGDYGLIVADFVDDDKLYPYRSDERLDIPQDDLNELHESSV